MHRRMTSHFPIPVPNPIPVLLSSIVIVIRANRKSQMDHNQLHRHICSAHLNMYRMRGVQPRGFASEFLPRVQYHEGGAVDGWSGVECGGDEVEMGAG
jgi:hypothetical protein